MTSKERRMVGEVLHDAEKLIRIAEDSLEALSLYLSGEPVSDDDRALILRTIPDSRAKLAPLPASFSAARAELGIPREA